MKLGHLTKSASALAISSAIWLTMPAGTVLADATADCNTGGIDPTSLECGVNADADGSDALAVGTDSTATGTSTTAVGGESVANGKAATAFGWQASATAERAHAIGHLATASGVRSRNSHKVINNP